MGSFRPSGDFTREKYSLLNSSVSNQAGFFKKKRTKDSKKKRKEDTWRRRAEKGV